MDRLKHKQCLSRVSNTPGPGYLPLRIHPLHPPIMRKADSSLGPSSAMRGSAKIVRRKRTSRKSINIHSALINTSSAFPWISATVLWPARPSVSSNSAKMLLTAASTPACPAIASPYAYGRPTTMRVSKSVTSATLRTPAYYSRRTP